MSGHAHFSFDREYRYWLERTLPTEIGSGDRVLFVMLNPSTADAVRDDATIRSCGRLAKSWGYGRLGVCNLFALRATDPRDLRRHPRPIGEPLPHALPRFGSVLRERNDELLLERATEADLVVLAWGNNGSYLDRSATVQRLLRRAGVETYALGVTMKMEPRHPLYLPTLTEPVRF
jgi:hypothetical protein